jgi:uncharacterized membrane protein
MKTRLAAVLLLLSLVALAGCNQGQPGGPGTEDPNNKKPMVGQANETFNLSAPVLPTSLKQGEKVVISIEMKRGKDFDEEVKLEFGELPKGISIDPSSPTVKHGDTEAKLTIAAAKDAAIGDFTINVTGHPTKGADASVGFKVSVSKP